MNQQRKIGVIIDSLRMGIREGIRKAAKMGADGFQIFCTNGDMAPENMSKGDRNDFKKFAASLGLEISALCGDLGKGFLDPEVNKSVVPRCKEFVDLAVDLETRIVTSHIGRLPDDENDPTWAAGLEAFSDLGAYAESRGCLVAMETGPEEPIVLKRFLDKIDNKGIGVNYDPANLIMCGPFDHIGGVGALKDYIVHTHAKDGICLLSERTTGRAEDQEYLEVALGEGSVVFKHYLKALDDMGYAGFLTIEREVGDDPVSDVAAAVRFLRGIQV